MHETDTDASDDPALTTTRLEAVITILNLVRYDDLPRDEHSALNAAREAIPALDALDSEWRECEQCGSVVTYLSNDGLLKCLECGDY